MDEKQWDNCRRKTISTIYAHGFEKILSGIYTPGDPDEVLPFQEQNKFMYDVFLEILQTPMRIHFSILSKHREMPRQFGQV